MIIKEENYNYCFEGKSVNSHTVVNSVNLSLKTKLTDTEISLLGDIQHFHDASENILAVLKKLKNFCSFRSLEFPKSLNDKLESLS